MGGEVKTIEHCGAFNRIANPGCHVVLPCMCQFVSGTLSMRLQQMQVQCETKTKDNVFVTIKVAVQFSINPDPQSIERAQYRLTNARSQIESYVYDVVRSSVPKIELDDVFETKEEISNSIKAQLEQSMADFGYKILASPITDIEPNAEVKRAMNEINKAKRLRAAAQDEGEAEAARTEIQAKAEAEAKFMQGQGIARQRQAIIKGLSESVLNFKEQVTDINAKNVLDLMIVTQYFDMMKEIGAQSKTNAVFMNHSPGALDDLSHAVQKGFMAGLPAAAGFSETMQR